MTEAEIELMFEQHNIRFYMVSPVFKADICFIFRSLQTITGCILRTHKKDTAFVNGIDSATGDGYNCGNRNTLQYKEYGPMENLSGGRYRYKTAEFRKINIYSH